MIYNATMSRNADKKKQRLAKHAKTQPRSLTTMIVGIVICLVGVVGSIFCVFVALQQPSIDVNTAGLLFMHLLLRG